MRRLMLVLATAAVTAGLIVLNPLPSGAVPSGEAAPKAAAAVGWTDINCVGGAVSGPNHSAYIEGALATNNVRLYGNCSLDWTRQAPGNDYLKGILVPNDRTLEIAAGARVYLNPNQTLVPLDTRYGDIIRTRDTNAQYVIITGTGVIDGNGGQQTGLGFDGVQLQNATGSKVLNVKIQNIRGTDAMGGSTESFAVNILGGILNRVDNVTVTTTTPTHRAASSSGIATNHGSTVAIVNSRVSHLEGRCYTSYNTDYVTRTNNGADDCDAAAFGNEYGQFGRDIDNRYNNSGYGLDLVGETDFTATGMFIAGNDNFAVVRSDGKPPLGPITCKNISLQGDVWTGPYIGGNLPPNGACPGFVNNLIDH